MMEDNANNSFIARELIPLLLHFQGVLAWQASEEAEAQAGQERLAVVTRGAIRERILQGLLSIAEIRKPEIVVEIGAHEASFSMHVKRRLPDARVMAFEANPDVFNKHKERLAVAGVDYRYTCVTTHDGEQTFHTPLSSTGERKLKTGSILGGIHGSETDAYQVPASRLDTILGSVIDRPSMMWIDVEGAVAQVLEGATKSLENCCAIYIELENKRYWKDQMVASEAIEFLVARGLYPVIQDFRRRDQGNYLFLSKEMLQDERVISALDSALSTRALQLPGTRQAEKQAKRAARQARREARPTGGV